MTTFGGLVRRFDRWLRGEARQVRQPSFDDLGSGTGHAPGHRHLGPPPEPPEPVATEERAKHDQPWVPTGGLIDRQRRSERRS